MIRQRSAGMLWQVLVVMAPLAGGAEGAVRLGGCWLGLVR